MGWIGGRVDRYGHFAPVMDLFEVVRFNATGVYRNPGRLVSPSGVFAFIKPGDRICLRGRVFCPLKSPGTYSVRRPVGVGHGVLGDPVAFAKKVSPGQLCCPGSSSKRATRIELATLSLGILGRSTVGAQNPRISYLLGIHPTASNRQQPWAMARIWAQRIRLKAQHPRHP
jgi:hypothetical protein